MQDCRVCRILVFGQVHTLLFLGVVVCGMIGCGVWKLLVFWGVCGYCRILVFWLGSWVEGCVSCGFSVRWRVDIIYLINGFGGCCHTVQLGWAS